MFIISGYYIFYILKYSLNIFKFIFNMISRKDDSQIKELLYPDLNKKPLKNLIPKNYQQIKKIQEQNRIKKKQQLEQEMNNKSK